jgi:hypothetical protein
MVSRAHAASEPCGRGFGNQKYPEILMREYSDQRDIGPFQVLKPKITARKAVMKFD